MIAGRVIDLLVTAGEGATGKGGQPSRSFGMTQSLPICRRLIFIAETIRAMRLSALLPNPLALRRCLVASAVQVSGGDGNGVGDGKSERRAFAGAAFNSNIAIHELKIILDDT